MILTNMLVVQMGKKSTISLVSMSQINTRETHGKTGDHYLCTLSMHALICSLRLDE
jgi:hypothetical protein